MITPGLTNSLLNELRRCGADPTGQKPSASGLQRWFDRHEGRRCFVPPGRYRLDQPCYPKGPVEGVGMGWLSECRGTVFLPDPGVTALVLEHRHAQRASVSNLNIQGPLPWYGRISEWLVPVEYGGTETADGIRVQAAGVAIRDVCVWGMGRCGVNITSEEPGAFTGSARLDRVIVAHNRIGLNIFGGESNGGLYTGCEVYANQLVGIIDRSFLTGTHVGHILHANADYRDFRETAAELERLAAALPRPIGSIRGETPVQGIMWDGIYFEDGQPPVHLEVGHVWRGPYPAGGFTGSPTYLTNQAPGYGGLTISPGLRLRAADGSDCTLVLEGQRVVQSHRDELGRERWQEFSDEHQKTTVKRGDPRLVMHGGGSDFYGPTRYIERPGAEPASLEQLRQEVRELRDRLAELQAAQTQAAQ